MVPFAKIFHGAHKDPDGETCCSRTYLQSTIRSTVTSTLRQFLSGADDSSDFSCSASDYFWY